MRIGLASDIHGRRTTLVSWAKNQQLDVIVVSGDLDAGSKFPLPVYYCFGNNDDRLEYEDWRRNGLLENCRAVDDYETIEIGGLRWMFIGCKLNPVIGPGIVAPPQEPLPRVDVIVTHEAPIQTGVFPPHPLVEDVVRRVQPRWCFSGHRHEAALGYVDSTECVALGRSPESWAILQVESRSLVLPPVLFGGV